MAIFQGGVALDYGHMTTAPLANAKLEIKDADHASMLLHDSDAASTNRIVELRSQGESFYIRGRNDDNTGAGAAGDILTSNLINGNIGINTAPGDDVLEVNGRILGTASVGMISLTQHHTHTQSGVYRVPFGQLRRGDSDDFGFDSSEKGLIIKKTGQYLIMFHQNWNTCSTTGRLDVAIEAVGGGGHSNHTIHQISSGMTSYQSRPVWGFINLTSAPWTFYVTYSTSFTCTFFWHGCGALDAYRLN